jgi:hypothetical protein
MAAILSIENPEARGAALQQDAMMLSQQLSMQRDIVVEQLEDAPIQPGQKGAMAAIGSFLISVAAPEATKALIDVIRHYLTRNTEAKISVTGADGTKIEIASSNMNSEQIVSLVRELQGIGQPAS